MKKKESSQLAELMLIINGWKVNKAHLAFKVGINANTFKLKLNPNFPQYKLTEEEQYKCIVVLKELAEDIQSKFGMTFNNKLAKMTRKRV